LAGSKLIGGFEPEMSYLYCMDCCLTGISKNISEDEEGRVFLAGEEILYCPYCGTNLDRRNRVPLEVGQTTINLVGALAAISDARLRQLLETDWSDEKVRELIDSKDAELKLDKLRANRWVFTHRPHLRPEFNKSGSY
jgi:hypothetical protein